MVDKGATGAKGDRLQGRDGREGRNRLERNLGDRRSDGRDLQVFAPSRTTARALVLHGETKQIS